MWAGLLAAGATLLVSVLLWLRRATQLVREAKGSHASPGGDDGANPTGWVLVRHPTLSDLLALMARAACVGRVSSTVKRVDAAPQVTPRTLTAVEPDYRRDAVAAAKLAEYCAIVGIDAPVERLPPVWPGVRGEVLFMLALLLDDASPFPAVPFPVHIGQRIEVLTAAGMPAVTAKMHLTGRVGRTRLFRPQHNEAAAGAEEPPATGIEAQGIVDGRTDPEGDVVYRSISTALYRFPRGGSRHRPKAAGTAAPPRAFDVDAAEREGRLLSDACAEWEMSASLGRRYASASDDFNPFHVYSWAGRMAGFRGAIAHGMWALSRAVAAIERGGALPRAPFAVQCEFRKPMVIPGAVKFEAATEKMPGAAGDRVVFHVLGSGGKDLCVKGWVEPL